jgi:membrane protein YdbS with pleckstrin-like domain
MKKAWSVFWLVILSVVALNIIFAMIGPWVPTIAAVVVILVFVVAGIAIWRIVSKRRRFF